LLRLGLNKDDTCKILIVKCYTDNSVHLWSFTRNVNIRKYPLAFP
jgi:hypothetical protein